MRVAITALGAEVAGGMIGLAAVWLIGRRRWNAQTRRIRARLDAIENRRWYLGPCAVCRRPANVTCETRSPEGAFYGPTLACYEHRELVEAALSSEAAAVTARPL